MKFTLDMSHLDDIEQDITVLFKQAITLPVLVDGKDYGVAIYVGFTSLAAYAHGRSINVARVMDVAGRLKLVNEDEDPRPQHPFTVIGVWESTGETLAEHVFAADPHEAMATVAGCRDNPADLTILGAVDGKISMTDACEDSGKAACALDLCRGERA